MQAFLVLSLFGADPEPFIPPKGNPPQLLFVSAEDGFIMATQTVAVPVSFAEKRVRVLDGKKVEEVVTVTKMVKQLQTVRTDLRRASFSTANGKKLEAAKALERLAKPSVIVLAEEGKRVDAAFLKVLAPETIVVVPPKAEVPLPIDPKLAPRPVPFMFIRPRPGRGRWHSRSSQHRTMDEVSPG